jgi:hypothetical protein
MTCILQSSDLLASSGMLIQPITRAHRIFNKKLPDDLHPLLTLAIYFNLRSQNKN